MMRRVVYSKDAIRTLRRMPANLAALISAKVEQYVADPASLSNNVKALQGMKGIYRLRVGDWRVLFSEDGTIVAVIKVAPRGGAYD